jgi:flagella basal body P-ring formation protein FlgA
VAVAKTFLKRHQEIGEKDVQWVRKNIALLPSDIVTELKDVRGKRMTLALNRQEIFRTSMLENPPVVKKGDRVILLVENDLFKIITYGEVKEEGRKGDRIKLVNLSSKKEVCGRVLNFSTVQVDY